MDSKTFWGYVKLKEDALRAAHVERQRAKNFQGQPEDGTSLFIVSKENLERDTVPGAVIQVGVRLAAQRIVEQTHEVASAEVIGAYKASQLEHARKIATQEFNLKKQNMVIHQDTSILRPPAGIDTTSPEFLAAVAAAVAAHKGHNDPPKPGNNK